MDGAFWVSRALADVLKSEHDPKECTELIVILDFIQQGNNPAVGIW